MACWLCEFLLIFLLFAASSQAAIWCFNGTRKPFAEDGPELTRKQCQTDQCAELLLPSLMGNGNYIDYEAGCDDICKTQSKKSHASSKMSCVTCRSDYCNTEQKNLTSKRAHTCLVGLQQPYAYEESVKLYCNFWDAIDMCYYRLSPMKDKMFGGCFLPGTDLQCDMFISRGCKICMARLCNEPTRTDIFEMKDNQMRINEASKRNRTNQSVNDTAASVTTVTVKPTNTWRETNYNFEPDYDNSAGLAKAAVLAVGLSASVAAIFAALL